jgi:hypothetical protein
LSAEVPLPGEKGIKSSELFMLGSDEVELRETSATVKGMVVIIKSQAKLYTGTSVSPGTMRGLLVVTDDTAARRGYWVNFAVPPANAAVPRTKPAQGNK